VKEVLCAALNVYLLVLVARAILSWFPVRPGTGLASILRVLMQLTEPVLAPVRRIIPPAGMFDLSFIVVFIGLQIIISAVLKCPGRILG
jgi:YggT family protein